MRRSVASRARNNVLSTGHCVSVVWYDRQGVIESQKLDLAEDLPHFLLLLLILQRLDGTRSGSFNNCPETGFRKQGETVTATFRDEDTAVERTFVFYPKHDKLNDADREFTGRGTFIFGGREGPAMPELLAGDVGKIRQGNDHVVKVCWPNDSWTREADILEKVREYGRKIDLIGDHIPDMVCRLDPTWICSSTRTIRQFLGLPTEKSRSLHIIVFRRLRPIGTLKEKQMFTAFLQCFFCASLTTNLKRTTESFTPHRPLPIVEEGGSAL